MKKLLLYSFGLLLFFYLVGQLLASISPGQKTEFDTFWLLHCKQCSRELALPKHWHEVDPDTVGVYCSRCELHITEDSFYLVIDTP
jgi:hypothetical protein